MKQVITLLFASCLLASAETKEQINKKFTVQPGGKLVVDIDFGSIDVSTNSSSEVIVDVLRTVSRSTKSAEETFLHDHPITFSQEGDTVTISARGKNKSNWWRGSQRTEAKYTITVPAAFNAQLKTSGGHVAVSDLVGEVKAATSGGEFNFARLRGTLNGDTSGGKIRMSDCEGPQKVHTSGGSIETTGGSGSLDGETSGGSVTVKDFRGPVHVESSGGRIAIENVTGKLNGSTSGGSISAKFSAPLSEEVKLDTSGGGVTLQVPESSAFELDASTSGGSVSSDLPVSIVGKAAHSHLKGPVNGGGKLVILHTSGGSIHVKKT
jgi:hypothetical protein